MSSPRTWGCFRNPARNHRDAFVFPTHVGVFLLAACTACSCAGLPHARGGVSRQRKTKNGIRRSSPRTWGCFSALYLDKLVVTVFPTHVGVFPLPFLRASQQVRLPHARGGVSTVTGKLIINATSSPRTWGCFWSYGGCGLVYDVFPTHVGVFLHIPVSGLM